MAGTERPSQGMTDDERRAFLDEMTGSGGQRFHELREALDSKDRDLVWYLAFGRGVRILQEEQEPVRKRGGMARLALALGCSSSLITKSRYFADGYSEAEARTLAEEKVSWAIASAAFSLESKDDQVRWMRKAVRERWTGRELRLEVQKELKGPQRKGGRPRRGLKSHGPAADLLDLLRTSAEWLRHHHELWGKEGAGLLAQIGSLPPGAALAVVDRMEEAEAQLEAVASAASAIMEGLCALRRKLTRPARRKK